MLEIKREHTDLQINVRKLTSDLSERDKENKAVKHDFSRAVDENSKFKVKVKQQESALAELKKTHAQTQADFASFKADMGTKNTLISQLKEQIITVTAQQKKKDEV